MEDYRTDEERAEALKKWWKENGTSVVGGIVIGLATVFGWRSWQDYQITQARAASDIYQKLIVEVRNNENSKAREFANQILDKFPSTSYALFSHLILAKIDVENNDYQSATGHLQWVIDNADEKEFEHLARLRLARIFLAENKPEESLKILDSVDPGKFKASYEELKGDSYIKQGKIEEARNAYNQAMALKTASTNDLSLLELKIGSLGHLDQ